MMLPTIQGLWIGSELSTMEQLSIRSFLQHGHAYHLYVYEEPRNVPVGAVVQDANRVLPASAIFRYPDQGSFAGFANAFRYKLLLARGGWWVDTDVVCLRPLRFEADMVFASEVDVGEDGSNKDVVHSGILKAVAGSELLLEAWHACEEKDPRHLTWGETGSQLLQALVGRMGLERHVQPTDVFCPIPWREWRTALHESGPLAFEDRSHAVHLWNEMWRRAGCDKNGTFASSCLYERLKRRYGLA